MEDNRCNVLIVDDSATTRAVIKRTMTLSQLPVTKYTEAADGLLALEALAAGPIDLVVADLNMPNMGGVELTRRMKSDPKLTHIPVVIVSSESMETKIQALLADGVRGYIRKPFTPEQIRQKIGEVLKNEVSHV